MSQAAITLEEAEALVEREWSRWLPLDKANINALPALPGVYEVRLKDYSFPRLRGQTSTIYIGCTEDRELAKRLKALINGRHQASPRIERVKKELKKELEFRYRLAFNGTHAKELETKALDAYNDQHLERPPCNHKL